MPRTLCHTLFPRYIDFNFSALINDSKNCRNMNCRDNDIAPVSSLETSGNSTPPVLRKSTSFPQNEEESSQYFEPTLHSASSPRINPSANSQLICINEKLEPIMNPPSTIFTSKNVAFSNRINPLPSHMSVAEGNLSTISIDSSSIKLPGRCELSVTPVMKVTNNICTPNSV